MSSPVKKTTTKKAAVAKKPASHPTYAAMIKAAIKSLNDKTGSSKSAILKYILANYKVGDNINQVNSRLRIALKAGVKKNAFKQVKGTGASGSFKLGEAKSPKKAAPKKAKAPKSPKAAAKPKAAKKSPVKKAAKKSPKKPKSPKPKKVAVKKSPAKKAAKKSPKKSAKKTKA